MRKVLMILAFIFVTCCIGTIVYATIDSISEGDRYLKSPQLLESGDLPSQAQAYYLRDIAESLRIIAKRY